MCIALLNFNRKVQKLSNRLGPVEYAFLAILFSLPIIPYITYYSLHYLLFPTLPIIPYITYYPYITIIPYVTYYSLRYLLSPTLPIIPYVTYYSLQFTENTLYFFEAITSKHEL